MKLTRLDLERAEDEAELNRLKAQCAAMRSALETADTMLRYSHGLTLPSYTAKEEIHTAIKAALALDAGKGYVPVDKARVIAEGLLLAANTAEAYTDGHRPSPEPGSPKDTWRKALATAREHGLLEEGR